MIDRPRAAMMSGFEQLVGFGKSVVDFIFVMSQVHPGKIASRCPMHGWSSIISDVLSMDHQARLESRDQLRRPGTSGENDGLGVDRAKLRIQPE